MTGKTKELFEQLQKTIEKLEASLATLEKDTEAYHDKLSDELEPMGKPPKGISPIMAMHLADTATELEAEAGRQAKLIVKARERQKELLDHLTARLSRTQNKAKVQDLIATAKKLTF